MTPFSHLSSPAPTLCEGTGVWCMWTQSLGQGKDFERSNQIAALTKSCDSSTQEFGRTNPSAGLFLLCNLLNRPRSCFDQSEHRFVPCYYNNTPHAHYNTPPTNQGKCPYSPAPLSLAEGGVWERDYPFS